MVESNEIAKKDFNIERDSVPLEEQKKYLINLLKRKLVNFRNWKKKLVLTVWDINTKLKEEDKKILVIIKIQSIYLEI